MRFTKYIRFGDYHWEQYARGMKYKAHADRIAGWVTERNLLDIGAGDGLITHLVGAKGIEFEPEGVRLAKEHGVDVIQGDAYALPFADNSFDACLLIDVLEHFDDPLKALVEARRVAPILYVNTPPKKDDGTLTDKFHVQEWSPAGLVKLVESVGYKLDGFVSVYPKEKLMYARFK